MDKNVYCSFKWDYFQNDEDFKNGPWSCIYRKREIKTNEIEYYFEKIHNSIEYMPLFETINKLNSRIDDLEKKNKELEDKLLALEYAPPNSKFNEFWKIGILS